MLQPWKIPRRHFLIGASGAAGALAAGLPAAARDEKALPNYVSWKRGGDLIVHSPQTIETKRGAIGTSIVTATNSLFVRNNLPPPGDDIVAEPTAWRVAFEGVANPREMTIADLQKIGVETVAAVLQCSGNGRAFFDHEASGTQWEVGAAGCVFWSGVPVRAVIEELGGLRQGRRFMTSTGGEELPQGIDPKTVIVERSVPLEASEAAILAWELNGEPVPIAHGGPLRMVIPGFYGVNNVKYVKRVAFTEQETDAQIQRTGYRVRPVGVKGAPDQPSMWQMNVKSWITHPLEDQTSGRIILHGVAFGGTKPVRRVSVSTDGGKTWEEASLVGPDLGQYAWRPFVHRTNLQPGTYTAVSRATDAEGNTQPETMEPNERGYAHNGWRDHAVGLTVIG